jgi:hypothetical protein
MSIRLLCQAATVTYLFSLLRLVCSIMYKLRAHIGCTCRSCAGYIGKQNLGYRMLLPRSQYRNARETR